MTHSEPSLKLVETDDFGLIRVKVLKEELQELQQCDTRGDQISHSPGKTVGPQRLSMVGGIHRKQAVEVGQEALVLRLCDVSLGSLERILMPFAALALGAIVWSTTPVPPCDLQPTDAGQLPTVVEVVPLAELRRSSGCYVEMKVNGFPVLELCKRVHRWLHPHVAHRGLDARGAYNVMVLASRRTLAPLLLRQDMTTALGADPLEVWVRRRGGGG